MRSPMLLIKVVTVYGSLLNKTQWRGWRGGGTLPCFIRFISLPTSEKGS